MTAAGEAADAQRAVYRERADAYARLVAAEDVDGAIGRALAAQASIAGARALDVGCGTGRLTRVLRALGAAHVLGVDREPAMLEVARRTLGDELACGRVSLREADARSLEIEPRTFDVATAGWCFGHFRHWMPDRWEAEVDAALSAMERAVRRGGAVLVLETLGTGHETPRHHPGLEAYFARLEARGYARSWIRTDYLFASVDEAAEVLGAFFPSSLVESVCANRWRRVPECTGVWSRTLEG